MRPVSDLVEDLLRRLAGPESLRSLERDPYWPKWDSPWWQMQLLHEMGLSSRIPRSVVDKTVEILKNHYLPFFPLREEEIPAGTDPYRRIACHCAVGGMYQILFAAGVDVDLELPWMRAWILKHQLPDGGVNCDEKAYLKSVPKSSVVSTLPCLEAILLRRDRDLTEGEREFLERGAKYLRDRRLVRRASSDEIIDQDWLEIRFPRFYDYDFLRGYSFLVRWRAESGFVIPDELTEEVEVRVRNQSRDGRIVLKRYNLIDRRSYNPRDGGLWAMGEASEIELMKAVSFDGAVCDRLTCEWDEIKPRDAFVNEGYVTVYPDPIRLREGESVRVEREETEPEWRGWTYCVDGRGVGGWVPGKILSVSGGDAKVLRDYEATELTVSAGDRLKVLREDSGWAWCRAETGARGWVPLRNLKLV